MSYHYKVVNSLDDTDIPLNSARRLEFNGYSSYDKAYMQGLSSKIENRLSDLYIVEVFVIDTIIQNKMSEI